MNVNLEAQGNIFQRTVDGRTTELSGRLDLEGEAGDLKFRAIIRNGKGYQEPGRIMGNVLQLGRRVGQERLALRVDGNRVGREAQAMQIFFDSSLTQPTIVGVQRNEDGTTLVGGEVSIGFCGRTSVVFGQGARGEIKIRTGGR